MPKQTFFNLPEDKRQKIIDLAVEEFASRPYTSASLSNVVAKAGIAKGSMYQYFENKKDLFLYLMDLAVQEKVAFINSYHFDPEEDFFILLEKLIMAGMRFYLEHPHLGKLVANALEPYSEFQELSAQSKQMSLDYYQQMVKAAQQKGTIRKDLESRLIAHLLYSTLASSLFEPALEKLGVSVQEFLQDPAVAKKYAAEYIGELSKNIISFLKNGLQPS